MNINLNLNCFIDEGYKNTFEPSLITSEAQEDIQSGRQEFPQDRHSSNLNVQASTNAIVNHSGRPEINEHSLNINSQPSSGNIPANSLLQQTEEDEATFNDQQFDPQQLLAQPIVIPEIEAKVYLIRKIGFFIASIIFSIAMLLMMNGTISKRKVFSVAYVYITYLIVENIKRARNRQRETWRRNEDSLAIIWLVSLKISLILIAQKLSGLATVSSLAAVPLFVYTIMYIIKSEAPKAVKIQKSLIDFTLTTQALVIGLKLDNVITWHWNVVFIVSFLFLLVLAVYLALFTSHLLVMLLLDYFPLYEHQTTANIRIQSIGVVWRVLANGMGIFLFVGILGVNTANTQNDYEYLHFAAMSSIYLNIILLCYTFLKFKDIVEYVKLFGLMGITSVNPDDLVSSEPPRRVLQFHTEKTETYFLMVSSTYFMPLNNDSLTKNQQRVQRIKDIITGLTPKSNPSPKSYNKLHNEGNEFIDVEMTSQPKEDLNNKEIEGGNKAAYGMSSNAPSINLDDLESNHVKQGLSTADTDATAGSNANSKAEIEEEEHLCYICYANPCNAILMDCGHGGICYQCAIFSMQKKNQCMECRGNVDAIYRVNAKSKGSNMIKGVEVTKIIEVTSN